MTPDVAVQAPVMQAPLLRLTRGSKLFKIIIKAIQDKKGVEILSLDLKNIPEAVADFFIICTAGSTTQVKAIADAIDHEVAAALGEDPYHKEGFTALQWVIMDYVNVVVHIMHPEARQHFRLEDMWSDAQQMGHDS